MRLQRKRDGGMNVKFLTKVLVALGSVGLLASAGCAGKTPFETVIDNFPMPSNEVAAFATAPIWMPLFLGAALISPPPAPAHDDEEGKKARLEAYSEKLRRGEPIAFSECIDSCTDRAVFKCNPRNSLYTDCVAGNERAYDTCQNHCRQMCSLSSVSCNEAY
jgi:hypothetical protein